MTQPAPTGPDTGALAYSKPTLIRLNHGNIDGFKSRFSAGEITTTGPNQQYFYSPNGGPGAGS